MDIEKVFKAIYAQGYRNGIVHGERNKSEEFVRESPRHAIDKEFECSKAKLLAVDLEKMLDTNTYTN